MLLRRFGVYVQGFYRSPGAGVFAGEYLFNLE